MKSYLEEKEETQSMTIRKTSHGYSLIYSKVLEDIVILMCKFLKNKFDKENLCLAGGVALNCVANGKILKEKIFKIYGSSPRLEMQEELLVHH